MEADASGGGTADWRARRAVVLREAFGVGVAVGTLGVSFGALATASGLTIAQACALSILAFTGGSQFAFIGVLAAGGAAFSAVTTALLLGVRNSLYGIRLAHDLGVRRPWWRRALAAQLVIDETTAVAIAHEDDRRAFRLGFWATGAAVFIIWNAFTLLGAVLGQRVSDPAVWGLDAAVPAAFLALLWPRLQDRRTAQVALGAAIVALVAVPFVPAGAPVLLAGLVAVAAALRPTTVRGGDAA
jgi:predicted branched-subunit amino acid permease